MTEREGTGQPRRYCKNCGSKLRPGDAFCRSCGEQWDAGGANQPTTSTSPESLGTARTGENQINQSFKKVFDDASARYRNWRETQAAERERIEALRAVEREREARRGRFDRYLRFFEKAYSGSRYALDWWQAYQDEEPNDEQTTTLELLKSAVERAEAGLNRMHEMEGTFFDLLEREDFEKADFLLDGMKVGQENIEGQESVFSPLVAVHGKIKRLDSWANYRQELEKLVKDLEDLLGSSKIRTVAADRLRFPHPDGARPSESGATTFPNPAASEAADALCPNCGKKNGAGAKFCFNCGTALPHVVDPQGPLSSSRVAAQPQDNVGLWVLLSVVFAVVALFFFPPLFGGFGVYFGYKAKQEGNEAGGVALMVVSGACMLFGMLWGSLSWGL